jgi:predicted O-methyltransferase YrrM
MIYEFNTGLKTFRKEGVKPFVQKVFAYFSQMLRAIPFSLARKPHGRPPGEIVDFVFTAGYGLIYPGQIRSEFVQLVEVLKKRNPRVIVEIGTATGGSLCAWCALAADDATIISIDLPGGIHGGGYAYWRTFIYRQFTRPGQTLHLLRADSHQTETLAQLKKLLPPGGIDFLFIDGDHTYEGVKKDFEMYSPLVRPGGYIAFHDTVVHPPEIDVHVNEYWRDIRVKYSKTMEFIESPTYPIGLGIGVIEL